MKSFPSKFLCAAALTLALPLLGMCATVTVTGSPVTYPGTSSGGSNTNVTVNGDPFNVNTSYQATFNTPGSLTFTGDPIVTYKGAAPLTNTDVVTINFFETFSKPGQNFNGTYNQNLPFSVPTFATASGESFIDGQGLGMSPTYGPGTYDYTSSATLSGLPSGSLTDEISYTFDFQPGFMPGGSISSTPEPAQVIPVAMGLIGFGLFALRRRTRSNVA